VVEHRPSLRSRSGPAGRRTHAPLELRDDELDPGVRPERENRRACLERGEAADDPRLSDEDERARACLELLVADPDARAPARDEVELLVPGKRRVVVRPLGVLVDDLLPGLGRDERVDGELPDPEVVADLLPLARDRETVRRRVGRRVGDLREVRDLIGGALLLGSWGGLPATTLDVA
jgi:hypothetical protein